MILLGFNIILPNQALALKLNKIAIKRYIRYTMRKLYYTLLLLFLQVGISFGQEWQVVSQMPIPVSGAVAFTSDSLIYIYGGHNSRYFTTPALLQIYDPRNNQWKVDTIGSFSNSRYGGTGGFWDGSAYFFGGPLDSVASNMDVWNLQGDSQLATTRKNDNFKRHFARSEIVHGKIYCFGGYWNNINANDRPLLPYIFIYDIATQTIEKEVKANYTNELPHHQMTARIGNRIYILGGTFNGILNTVTYFNIETNALQRFDKKLVTARYGGTAHAVGDSAIMLIGGWGGRDDVLDNVEIVPLKNSTSVDQHPIEISALNVARAEHVSIKLGDDIYIFGGRNNQENVDVKEVEKYSLLVTDIEKKPIANIQDFQLNSNYPNPFNPETVISYQLLKTGNVNLVVFNITGKRVATLFSGKQQAGLHKTTFNGANLASGIYFYLLETNTGSQTKRMILMK